MILWFHNLTKLVNHVTLWFHNLTKTVNHVTLWFHNLTKTVNHVTLWFHNLMLQSAPIIYKKCSPDLNIPHVPQNKNSINGQNLD